MDFSGLGSHEGAVKMYAPQGSFLPILFIVKSQV